MRFFASRFHRRLRSKEHGVALILTLAIIALVTLLLIAFVTSMRVESAASKNFNDLIKSRELAKGAIDQAVATIRQATPQRTDDATANFSTYVTFPGVIWQNKNGTKSFANLYTQNTADQTNLNAGFWITGQNQADFINEPDCQINVGWIYVANDGTQGPSPLNNEIIGRFCYWVDDEASKINLNTAGTPNTPTTPDYGTSVSNDVDLSMLLPSMNAAVSSIVATQGLTGFATVEEVKRADTATLPNTPDGDFNTNRFYLTAYSSDANYPSYADDLDAFDRPRLILSALNIRDVNGSGGGGTNNAFAHLSDPMLGQMYGLSGATATYRLKYPVVGTTDGLKQIIANIIAYQNSTATPLDGGGTPPTFLGLAKTPYLNEIQVKYTFSGTPPAVTVTRSVQVELIYLYDTAYAPAGETITVSGLPSGPGFSTAPVTIPVSGSFSPGPSYLTFTESAETPVSVSTPTTLVATPIQVAYGRGGSRLDYAGIILSTVTLDPTVPGTPAAWHGAQAGDPCVNDVDGDWEKYTNPFVGTLGTRNVWQNSNPFTGGAGPAAFPFGADISKAVIRGAAMQSVGELGYIHRPEPFKHLGMSTNIVGQIPDWGMMDLFTVANPPTVPTMAGRININSFINPGFPNNTVRRSVPLKALLNSVLSPPDTVAQAIYDDTTRTVGIDSYGMRNGRDGIFDTIGEVCEIPGVADNGAVSEAVREAAIRRIANLITVRSSTFTIWVMAQTIKQTPSTPPHLGTYTPSVDVITGETRIQAVVERYENPPGGAPKFRTRYLRYLYN